MSLLYVAVIIVGCMLSPESVESCIKSNVTGTDQIAGIISKQEAEGPVFTGEALDVVLTAKAALVWDQKSGKILYEKNADEKRPVASLSKLLSALVIREEVPLQHVLEISKGVEVAQKKGADVRLPVGQHATVADLLGAGLVASANDAMVALAIDTAGSEEKFIEVANKYAQRNGLFNTQVSNATGLAGGKQYSTARDVMKLFKLAYRDKEIRNWLVTGSGSIKTKEGSVRYYKTTDRLLGTYFPVLAAKTGYTVEAGGNLVVMTYGEDAQRIGVVVLGSKERFQDTKVLVEWIWRNYTW